MKKKESETAIGRAPGQMTQLPVVSSTRRTTDEECSLLTLTVDVYVSTSMTQTCGLH